MDGSLSSSSSLPVSDERKDSMDEEKGDDRTTTAVVISSEDNGAGLEKVTAAIETIALEEGSANSATLFTTSEHDPTETAGKEESGLEEAFMKPETLLFNQLRDALRSQFVRLQQEKQRLSREASSLQLKRAAFEEVKRNMAEVLKLQESRVKLSVGGEKFVTSLDTLLMYPDSMLGNMFSGKYKLEKDEKGYFFIDRDGTHFRYILNFLRTGTLVVPEEQTILRELRIEAEFYQIRPLIDALSVPITGQAQFSSTLVHKNIRLVNSERTTVSVATKGTCRVLIDTASVHRGRNYWEIRLDKLQNPNCIAIGVSRTTGELSQYVGSTKDGYSIIVMNRDTVKKWNSPICEEYGLKSGIFQEGDRVGMLLDYSKGETATLTFYLNGASQGIAFSDLPPHLFPAVSLHSKGDQISLVASKLPDEL